MTPPRSVAPAAPSIAGIVLSGRRGPPRRVTGFALVVGLAVHLGVGWASAMLPPPSSALVVAARPQLRVSMAREIPVPPPAPVEPLPPAPEPVLRQAASLPSREAAAEVAPPAEPTPPAEPAPAIPAAAAEVVQSAADPATAEPLDFSMVAGAGQVYAGGVTASTGTSTSPVHTDNADARHGVPGGTGTGTAAPRQHARPVGQPTRQWRCDWPAAASSLDVDVEFVNMRVDVEASGEITDVRVIRHSGYGFDVEARRCALRHSLPPARDARGTPVRTASHPIRLRFER
ncbi:MAG: energy transducer TonB [Sandaracinaceae bacterium]|nr:energy transducer TonB [Sandaracinaceae bacterium]